MPSTATVTYVCKSQSSSVVLMSTVRQTAIIRAHEYIITKSQINIRSNCRQFTFVSVFIAHTRWRQWCWRVCAWHANCSVNNCNVIYRARTHTVLDIISTY